MGVVGGGGRMELAAALCYCMQCAPSDLGSIKCSCADLYKREVLRETTAKPVSGIR